METTVLEQQLKEREKKKGLQKSCRVRVEDN